MQYTNRHLATKKIHMIAFRLILLRIKFTTCATCHAFYLKRYQTSCSFCVYIVSTHHATILIASLILQIPASPTISTQRRQILLLHPISPSLPLSSSNSPPPHQSQHNPAKFSKFPSIRSQFSTPFGSNPPIIPLARPLSLLHPPYSPNSLPHSAQIPL